MPSALVSISLTSVSPDDRMKNSDPTCAAVTVNLKKSTSAAEPSTPPSGTPGRIVDAAVTVAPGSAGVAAVAADQAEVNAEVRARTATS